LALLGVMVLSSYHARAYDHRYVEGEQIATRPFWHNILSGFAFSPFFADRYGLKIDDLSEIGAVERFLAANGRSREWEAMGGNTPGYSHLRWPDYEPVARELLMSFLKEHPWQFFATILYHKPASLLRHLAWIYGLRRDIPDVDLFVSRDLGNAMALQMTELQLQLDRRHLRFSLFNPIAAAVVAVFAGLLALPRRPPLRWGGIPFVVISAGSLIPTLVGYPAMHTLSEPALILPTALYAGAAAGLSCAFLLPGRLRRRHPTRVNHA